MNFTPVLIQYTVPFQAQWLNVIGLIFFILNVLLFVTNVVLITARFCLRPGSFRQSFTDQVESLFIPASVSWSDLNILVRGYLLTVIPDRLVCVQLLPWH